MLDALSRARRRFVLGVTGLVVAALITAVVATVLQRKPPVEPVAQEKPGPVLLVPGYGGSRASLTVLAGALEASGRQATVVSLAGDGTGDLRDQAHVLDGVVREELDRTAASSVDIVGFSAGGVIARLWVHDFGGGNLARRVVMLGSPNHGTDLARLAVDVVPDTCPVACQQLAGDSDVLRVLNAGDETPLGPLWVSIWTTDDRVVVPPESASLEGAVDFSVQSVCPDVTVEHGDLPRNPTVIALTLRELGTATPAIPDSRACDGLSR